jgi:hypothetical protein
VYGVPEYDAGETVSVVAQATKGVSKEGMASRAQRKGEEKKKYASPPHEPLYLLCDFHFDPTHCLYRN